MHKKRKGQAAILSITIVSMVAIIISSSMSVLIVSELRMAQNAENSISAFYAAEGAMNDLLTIMKKDNNWPNVPYNDIISINGVYVVRTVEGDVNRDITVIANLNEVTKKIKGYCNRQTGNCNIYEVEP